MISSIRKSRLATLILIILGCVLVFMVQWNASELLAPLHLQSKSLVRYILKCLLSLIPVTIIMFILHKPSAIMESLGFKGSILRGLLFGFLFTTPLYIGFAIIGHFNAGLTLHSILYFSLIPALFEEILFRGFIFGQLFRVGKLGFFWDLMSSLAAFGVTMLGSFFFSWMFVAWDYNLMVPISLHFFMNLAWGLFIVEGTGNAAGGLASNILRAVCLIFAIMFTVIYDKRNNKDALKFPVFKL